MAGDTDAVSILAGETRIDTALEISGDLFSDVAFQQADGRQPAEAVVLSRADVFADALAGTPLATSVGGPILLTPSDQLLDSVLAEIRRILPPGSTVYLLGGTAALGPAVEQAVAEAGYEPVRFGGDDRYATAVAIADQGLDNPDTLLFATGGNFPDALAAGAAASRLGGAVLLTSDGDVPPAVAAYMQGREVTMYAIGGPAAAAMPDAVPMAGASRFSTAEMVARTFFADHTVVGIASGLNFPDALAGGVHAAFKDAPLLLSHTDGLSAESAEHIRANPSIERAFLYGGTAALGPQVAVDAAGALE